MSRFFIDRPVFAWVVAVLIALAGVLCITGMPIAQYPSIAPPSISVTANYAGASAETLQDTVTSVIEQQLNGIDNLLYMSASADASGVSTITLFFNPGTNPDTAQVQVQNKVQLATPRLPATVQQQGITVQKATRNFLMIITLSSKDGSLDEIALGNYIASSVLDPIRRVPGVGEATQFGTEYAMRVWLNPEKLNSFNLTAVEVRAALAAQNLQVPVGQLGAQPAGKNQQLNVVLQGRSTLRTPEEFGKILLRVNPDGSRVRLSDVARMEMGGQDYSTAARVNGKPASAMAVKLSPGGNALETTAAIRAKLADLSKFFPPGVEVIYPLDTSAFVKISIEEVIKTLLEAIALVFLVMLIFLQSFRTTLIPTVVVPIALLGTFAALYLFGFSINVLTMFAMVLAIGILIDDAIVVVEAVERIMSSEGLSPRDATRKAMGEITGALMGITVVLIAVFIPMAFFSGSVGAIYRQFSITLVCAMLFSIFLAMTLTPALCATFLKPVEKGHKAAKGGLYGWFNRVFDSATNGYQGIVGRLLKKVALCMLVYAVLAGAMVFLYLRMPSGFLPEEDQGYFITVVQLPVGATYARNLEVIKQMEDYYAKQPEIESYITVAGFSFNGRGQNAALAFVRLKEWSARKGAEHKVQGIIGRAFAKLGQIKDAIVFPINPPAVAELGNASGFDFYLQDKGNVGHVKLMEARDQLLGLSARDPRVSKVRPQGLDDAAQLRIQTDEDKASALGVSLADINVTLETNFSSSYINNFVNNGRVQRVIVQLDAPFRMLPDDIGKVFVRNATGSQVPVASFATLEWTFGSPQLQRYNGLPSVEIVGAAPPGKSTGQAMDAIEEMTKKLPAGLSFEWTGQSYEERLSGSQSTMLYSLSLIAVFLCLAALYESWSIPAAVLLVVPLGILGALLATTLRGMPNDVYFKVGMLVTVGLSAKNAILIIEYAKDMMESGKSLVDATLEAVHLRLRPILMTSIAFILGVTPLAISTGAGSASQNAIGTGVIGGMLTGTVLALFFVPVFFVLVRGFFKGKDKKKEEDDRPPSAPQPEKKKPAAAPASKKEQELVHA
jgi:multidrug efflux pump